MTCRNSDPKVLTSLSQMWSALWQKRTGEIADRDTAGCPSDIEPIQRILVDVANSPPFAILSEISPRALRRDRCCGGSAMVVTFLGLWAWAVRFFCLLAK